MSPNRFVFRALLLGCAPWLLCTGPIIAQSIQPVPPAEFDVQIRYRLRAPLPQWFDLFDQMLASLKAAGFQRTPRPADEPEDPDSDRLTGTIASANAHKLLLHPYVQTIFLTPRGYKPPTDADKRIKVNLELTTGLPPDRQHLLSEQILRQLEQVGFRESVGYDHKGYSRIFGTIDAYHLGNLLRDLRGEPSGWLVPRTAVNTLPSPLRGVVPIRVVEVRPEPRDVVPSQEPSPTPVFPEGATHLAKLSPEVRELAANEKDDQKRLRLELVLAHSPQEVDQNWERELRLAAVGLAIEGHLGNVVTVVVRPAQVAELARPANVLAVRLPRSGEGPVRPTPAEVVDALTETRLRKFHERGFRAEGIKIAIVAGDFGGYQRFVGNRLPKETVLIDFTAARNSSLLPDPMPSDDGRLGQGTLCALAARLAAPAAPLVLVRVDPTAPYQLLTIARLINDDVYALPVLEDRRREIERDGDILARRQSELQEERRKALEALVFDEGNSRLPELKKRYEESQARLKKVLQDVQDLKKDEGEHKKRIQRFLSIRNELTELSDARVVVCPLVWNDGYPLDGGSALSRYFDERPFVGYAGDKSKTKIASTRANRGTIWVQAGGDTRGQSWAGLFRDQDNNGALEFAAPTRPVNKERWTSELNFLGWEAVAGQRSADLPEKIRLRISIQWREPHDPVLANEFDDPYRDPIVNLGLVVLRQRDPTGTKLASDDLDLLARSSSRAVRLYQSATSGVYEQSLELEATAGGRLALRVEGRVPGSLRPASIQGLGTLRHQLEIRPRVFVEVIDPTARAKGRAVFVDYDGDANWPAETATAAGWPQFGGVGMPADARNVLTVGAAGKNGNVAPFSAVGAGPGRELLVKPDVLAFGSLELANGVRANSTAVAASYNAGAAACLIGSKAPAQSRLLLQLLQIPPGALVRIPETWLEAGKAR